MVNTEQQVYKKAAFARLAGVSRSAVTQAVATGFIICDDGLIDITHPKNASYLAQNRHKRPRLYEPEPEPEPETIEPEVEAKKVDEPSPKKSSKPQPQKKIRRPRGYDPSTDVENLTKEAADIKRITAQTLNYRLKYAERLKQLVLKTDVDRVFQNIYSIAINHFLVLGDRLAPVLASICGATDQKIIIEMKNYIDKEVTRALNELKRQTENNL